MQKYLPSKIFIKWMGLVIMLCATVLAASLLFSKKVSFSKSEENKADTVLLDESNFYQRDSDSDGVYDWEESLWGLDPKDKDSNDDGVSDGKSIELKKAEIKHKNNLEDETYDESKMNQTEVFARQLFSAASLAKQQGGLQADSLDAFSKSINQSLADTRISDPFSLKDIKLGEVNPIDYRLDLAKAFENYVSDGVNELEVLFRFSNGDTSVKPEVDKMATRYNDLTKKLSMVQTPHAAAGLTLGLVNNTAKLSVALLNVSHLEDDPILAVVGFSQYEEYSTELEQVLLLVEAYFENNDI